MLHDHGENPQKYIDDFFCKASNKLFGFDKLVNVVLVQGPVILEENDKGRRCAWNTSNQDLLQSEGYSYVNQILDREVQAMGGRADKLFLCGVGVAGHLAMLAAFHSQHLLGGVFCLDTPAPDSLLQHVQQGEAGAIYPNYEAKKSMFVCITSWKKKAGDNEKKKAQEQAQVLRGNGFGRVTLKELPKAMDKAVCQVHPYSRVGSQFEVDRMNSWRKARSGDFDKLALQKNGPSLGMTTGN